MDPLFPAALQYIREVQSKVAGDGRQTYDEFRVTLKQYRHRNIDSSIVISTAQTLFRDHPNLLDAFKHFVPSHGSAAAAAEGSSVSSCVDFLNRVSVRSCVDFLNRVGTRFDGGGAYCKFLECMHAYSRAEISASDVYDEVVGLFGKNDDLVDEFVRFLPESCVGERLKERKIDQLQQRGMKRRGSDFGSRVDVGERSKKRKIDQLQQQGMKRRGLNSGSRVDEEAAVAPPARRTVRRPMEKFGRDEEKAARRVLVDRHNDMEDSLCDIDVRIGNLESVRRTVLHLYGGISDGRLSPADVCLNKHFTALDLACIRSLGRKFLECVDHHLVPELPELMEVLMKKKVVLERERVKIVQKWNRLRQSQSD